MSQKGYVIYVISALCIADPNFRHAMSLSYFIVFIYAMTLLYFTILYKFITWTHLLEMEDHAIQIS